MTVTLSRRNMILAGAAIILIVAAAVIWALTGGGSSTPPAANAAPAATRTGAEATYLDQVKTTQAQLSDDEALRLGRDDCRGLDNLRDGKSVDFLSEPGSLEQLAKDGKLTSAQVHGIENAAVQFLCPANLEYRQSQIR